MGGGGLTIGVGGSMVAAGLEVRGELPGWNCPDLEWGARLGLAVSSLLTPPPPAPAAPPAPGRPAGPEL